MPGNTVTIVEDGKLLNVDEDHLRKGDLVVLQAGDVLPAAGNLHADWLS